jgi:UDP-N-acetylmuramate dehydrogenase
LYGHFIEKVKAENDSIIIKENEPMSRHTSFKVGGPVDVLIIPSGIESLIRVIKEIKSHGFSFMLIGKGSNLLVSDKGIRGIVIKITGLNNINIKGTQIIAESGASLAKIANTAYENSLAGMEFASGIPGTLGGAIYMNAGAYGGEMKDIIEYTEHIDCNGEVITIKKDNEKSHGFGYRCSSFQKNKGIVLKAGIRLCEGSKTDIKEKMNTFNKKRKEKQPVEMPCAGSIFKRPEGYFAGQLIEEAGLKGYCIGDACVSEKHSGFIVNNGLATAKDITMLISYIQNEVYRKFNVKLETEVNITGEV